MAKQSRAGDGAGLELYRRLKAAYVQRGETFFEAARRLGFNGHSARAALTGFTRSEQATMIVRAMVKDAGL